MSHFINCGRSLSMMNHMISKRAQQVVCMKHLK